MLVLATEPLGALVELRRRLECPQLARRVAGRVLAVSRELRLWTPYGL